MLDDLPRDVVRAISHYGVGLELRLINRKLLDLLPLNDCVTQIKRILPYPAKGGKTLSQQKRLKLVLAKLTEMKYLERLLLDDVEITRIKDLNLVNLTVKSCDDLRTVLRMKRLETLYLSHCERIRMISRLHALTTVELLECDRIATLVDLPKLHTLIVTGCPRLRNIADLPSLSRLEAVRCSGLVALKNVDNLESLNVKYCGSLALGSLNKLTNLHVTGHVETAVIRDFPMLRTVRLSFSHSLLGLCDLPALEGVLIEGCTAMKHVERLPSCTLFEADPQEVQAKRAPSTMCRLPASYVVVDCPYLMTQTS